MPATISAKSLHLSPDILFNIPVQYLLQVSLEPSRKTATFSGLLPLCRGVRTYHPAECLPFGALPVLSKLPPFSDSFRGLMNGSARRKAHGPLRPLTVVQNSENCL
ncbi:hypothetical protein Bbelb_435370 [Branchiostoma belcheri]|nr:hypothetical protein Bbelb_435370 [Branchiostoma belcheri]